ncbi:MAG TPA: maleylpyruvate isomerase family mycothiol-dependent enzyme [Acidimicrobiales bacterium]|nr:maleylpyruvate isomerase family mycothiol-dependent enzyme [Acidimicrobiales bacterium]
MSGEGGPGALPYESYLDAIGEEVERIAQLAARDPSTPVPSCPGWGVGDLVSHVAAVCRQWRVQLDASDPDVRTAAPEDGGDLEEEATRLLGALVRTGALAPCWNWTGADLVAGWVARRVAIEVALHRVDCEQAFGRATPIERELAVDGVDERLDVHLRAHLGRVPGSALGGSMCLVANDADAAWMVETARGQIRWRRGRGPADVVLVGGASDLLQFLWNRVDADVLARTGRREVALAWRSIPA